jgi:hypothetical protein
MKIWYFWSWIYFKEKVWLQYHPYANKIYYGVSFLIKIRYSNNYYNCYWKKVLLTNKDHSNTLVDQSWFFPTKPDIHRP